MRRSVFSSLSTDHLRMDFMGGLTAAVVALPLALAFGVASGAGPAAGVYGAIFVGFFAAIFGGTSTQVSGPTGPMTVVMAGVFTSLQAKYPETGMLMGFSVVILAGLMQIALGLLKLGKYFILVPYPVISGFMTGIGVIIIILQFGPILGHASSGNLVESFLSIPEWIQNLQMPAVILGVLTLAIVYLWPKKLAIWCPSPLAALLLGTVYSILFLEPGSVAVIGNIPFGLPEPHMPVFAMDVIGELFYSAALLAMLGAIDSLLTSLVADNLTKIHHDSDKELIGQGIGNTVAGFFGGLPGAGATMRTVVNIRAGGHTGYSGVIHSLALLCIMIGAGQYASHVPLAVLAGILIKVGIDIIDWSFLTRLKRLSIMSVGLMLAVLFMTVFIDLITAVLVGVFISNLVTVDRLTNFQLDSVSLTDGERGMDAEEEQQSHWNPLAQELKHYNGAALLLHLEGPLSFGVGRGLRRRLMGFVSHQIMIIDLTKAHLVGSSTALILDEVIRDELSHHRKVMLVGMSEKVCVNLTQMGSIEAIGSDWVFKDINAAMARVDALLS